MGFGGTIGGDATATIGLGESEEKRRREKAWTLLTQKPPPDLGDAMLAQAMKGNLLRARKGSRRGTMLGLGAPIDSPLGG